TMIMPVWQDGAIVDDEIQTAEPVDYSGPVYDLDVDQLRPDHVRRLIADLRLEISSVAFMDNPLDPDLTARAAMHAHLHKCIDAAAAIGAWRSAQRSGRR
ncbi:MAG: hypothetical protein ABR585_15510, partial [Gemmatimonadaceae bacterium]